MADRRKFIFLGIFDYAETRPKTACEDAKDTALPDIYSVMDDLKVWKKFIKEWFYATDEDIEIFINSDLEQIYENF